MTIPDMEAVVQRVLANQSEGDKKAAKNWKMGSVSIATLFAAYMLFQQFIAPSFASTDEVQGVLVQTEEVVVDHVDTLHKQLDIRMDGVDKKLDLILQHLLK